MNTVLALLQAGLFSLLLNPLLYIGLLLIAWDLGRNTGDERKYFGVRVTKVLRSIVLRWLQGILAGLVLSALCLVVGVSVATWEIWTVTGLSVVFAVIRVRFIAAPYAIAVVITASLVASCFHIHSSVPWLNSVMNHLQSFRVSGWMGLLSISFLGESCLLWLNQRAATPPAVVSGRRGRTIGALLVQLSFVVPVGVLTTGTHMKPVFAPTTWPWLSGATSGGYSVISFPMLMGMSAVLATLLPTRAIRRHAADSFVLGIVALIDAFLAQRFGNAFAIIGLGVAVVGREFTVWTINHTEAQHEPIFAESLEGVRVLGTLPGSLAQTMGLLPGELITHVNQVAVHSVYDLHFAFEQNPAYAKLNVLDARGEPRILGKPVYAGERTKLGLIVAPEGFDSRSSSSIKSGLLQTLYLGSTRRTAHRLEHAQNTDTSASTEM